MTFPDTFLKNTETILGNEFELFLSALNTDSPVSIRLNKIKTQQLPINLTDRVAWCNGGYYLAERPKFTFDPLFHAGTYYVQEASSMIVSYVFERFKDEKKSLTVLDLCAAPGGKSTLLADLLPHDGLLVSNEVIRSRASILVENLTKWGNPNCIVTNNDPSDFGQLNHFFDFILVDAPCSGEGMFRKDIRAVEEWSQRNVDLCQERQRRIVADIWDALKPGGLMLYSTCTYNRQENEDNVAYFCEEYGAETIDLNLPDEWNVAEAYSGNYFCYHFFPHRTKGEGFFCALLRKNGESDDEGFLVNRPKKSAKKTKNQVSSKEELAGLQPLLQNPENFVFEQQNMQWYALPKLVEERVRHIESSLKILMKGICLGSYKGKNFIPEQSLCLSNALDSTAFSSYEVDWLTAIRFLRKEGLVLPDAPLGIVVLTFRHIPIGFVKNLGSRANNLYPQEWCIRSSQIPENEQSVLL